MLKPMKTELIIKIKVGYLNATFVIFYFKFFALIFCKCLECLFILPKGKMLVNRAT